MSIDNVRSHQVLLVGILLCVLTGACSKNAKPVNAGSPPPSDTALERERQARLTAESEVERLRQALDGTQSELDSARQDSSAVNERMKAELAQASRQLGSLQSDYSLMMAQLSDALDEIERLREGLPSVQSRAFAVSLIADARVRVDAVSKRGEAEMRSAVAEAGELLLQADQALHDGKFGAACYLAQRAREAIRKKMVPVGNVEPLPAPQDFEVVSKSNLRVGPGTDHQRIGSAKPGDRLTALARKGEWFRVQTASGALAWIHASLVKQP